MKAPRQIKSVVIFGGGGLVGYQIARKVAQEFEPKKIVICALLESEANEAVLSLKREFSQIEAIVPEYGNLFVRQEYSNAEPEKIGSDPEMLNQVYHDVFGSITDKDSNIGQQNLMGRIIKKHKADIVVDCINTATAISYQDIKSSASIVKEFHDELDALINKQKITTALKDAASGNKESISSVLKFAEDIVNLATSPLESRPTCNNVKMMELLLISQAVPQLVRHVTLLYQALVAADTQMYVKVGTTGTGGMGINIPYTHGEDKPSFTLLAKSSVGFAHTGLLFLLARSPGPIIKEIKPGAMIGYRNITVKPIKKFKRVVKSWQSKQEVLEDSLLLRQDEAEYTDSGELKLVGIDTGENGFFTRAEFEAITYMNQMEFVTPEEIAQNVVFEICGDNTGKDVIAAIDGAIMDPSYRAGYIRQMTVEKAIAMEKEMNIPSIAIGELGPPQLSKLLYETYLMGELFDTVDELATSDFTPSQLSEKIYKLIADINLEKIITSLGLPILLPDGKTILRGPSINIPESKIHARVAIESTEMVDKWATQGWIDLRPKNMEVWQARGKKMLESRQKFSQGSSSFNPKTYIGNKIKTGEVVGWIFVNEFDGYRVKF